MSEEEYTIEYLIETFGKHCELFKKERELTLAQFALEKREIPAWMINEFNISLAFQVMCKEIKALKDKSDYVDDGMNKFLEGFAYKKKDKD